MFDVFRTFVFWTHGGFTALSRPLLPLYVICCTAVIHVGGWIASWSSLLYHVLLHCRKWVGRPLRCCCVLLSRVHGFVGYFFLFVFLSLYRPRDGRVQRVTINSYHGIVNTGSWKYYDSVIPIAPTLLHWWY